MRLSSLYAHALITFMYSNISACLLIPVQILPERIEAVNGSSTDIGCTSALVDSGDVMTCNSQSYLVDGCSPDIDTSTSDWASQLVTVRRNEGTAAVPIAHVLLTFGFDTAVSLTRIEMDLFHCPDWGIGAPRIRVYVNEEYNFVFDLSLQFTPPVQPSQSSCDSLTTVHVSGDRLSFFSYRTFHILVDLSHQSSIRWVHIGDVRFLSEGGGPTTSTCLPSFVLTMAPQLSSSSSLTSPVVADYTSSSSSLSLSSTCECYEIKHSAVSGESMKITSTIQKPLPSSVPGERGNDCSCSEATVIAVSAVSLLLIVTVTTVTLTQCLLIIRMRRSRDRSETYAEATNSTTKTTDVPVSLNEAYGMTKITTEEVTYELVK